MDVRKFMPLLALLLIISTAAAACDYNATVGTITINKAKYSAACISYEWTHAQTANDFNNYVIRASGDYSLADTNVTGKTFKLCTVEPGDTVTFNVQAYEGDWTGLYCGFDYNVTLKTGGYLGAMQFLVYTILLVLGGFIGVIILVLVLIWSLKAMGIKVPGMRK